MLDIQIPLQPKQREALELSETVPILFYGGARGGGKSYLIRAREFLRRIKYPNTKGLIIRKTYPELLSNHIREFFKEYPFAREWYHKEEKAIHYPNGSITEFSYLQHTDDVYNYQGREYEDISVDEVTQHAWETIQVLRGSNRTTNPLIKPSMILTGNPGGLSHHDVKRIFIDRSFLADEFATDYGFVQAKVWDNEALIDADPDYVKRLRALPEAKRKAWLDGSWDVYEGQFFTEFNRDHHVIDPIEIQREWRVYIGLDWGVNHPSAVIWMAEDFDRHLYCYRELYFNGEGFEGRFGKPLTPRRLARVILAIVKKAKEDYQYVVADPSMWNNAYFGKGAKAIEEGESIAEAMSNEGLKMIRGDNDHFNGWNRFREALAPGADGIPHMRITKSLPNLIREVSSAVYDDVKVEDLRDENDHALDATRYVLMSRPIAPVKLSPAREVNQIKLQLAKARRSYERSGEEVYVEE